MGTSGFIRGLYAFSVWVTRFVATNLLWLLFNFPIIFLFLNVIASKKVDDLLVNAITIGILSPFILFPATMAMFGVVRQWTIGHTNISIFSTFWKSYKENYVRSLLGGLIFIPLLMILAFDYYYFTQTSSPLVYVFLFISMFLYVLINHFFSYSVHMDLKLTEVLKNSFLLSVGNPVYTIGISLSSLIIIFINVKFFIILIFFGTGSLIAFSSFYLYYMSQKKLME